MSWREQAACHGVNPDVFFPPPGANQYAAARRYCARCPVSEDCLEFELKAEQGCGLGERHGMYGGATPNERWKFRRRTCTCEICGKVFSSPTPAQRVCPDGECVRNWHAA